MSPKRRKITAFSIIGLSVFMLIPILTTGVTDSLGMVFMMAAAGFIVLKFKSKKKPPSLDSYFRIMLSGGDRKFKFDKSGDNAQNIAQFINKVEETLTAYNKA
jgi:hypothetical protein